ncbi:hypothetical protein BC936DRAFT_141887 [Jimgerdemannia flammicorona]|uniref:Uncharacterized protein n=1 Tax=Jimgerdemannia flammicorona TaxID=994334 RepID=A0A433DFN9_9FUNG|nr:hypothetical protein BC936DRAFT_141887 [Jimgerdemannia flammicorona]
MEEGRLSSYPPRDYLPSGRAPTAAIIGQMSTLVSSSKTSRPIGTRVLPLMATFDGAHAESASCSTPTSPAPTGDAIIDKGAITLGGITNFFPFEDPVVIIRFRRARPRGTFAEKREGARRWLGCASSETRRAEPGSKVLVTNANGGGGRHSAQHPSTSM